MGRPKRIKFYDEKITYHIMSKTSGGDFLLKNKIVKRKFMELLDTLLRGFYFTLEAFVIMDNHFHLMVKSQKISKLSDIEIIERAKSAKIYKKYTSTNNAHKLREKLGDLSEFLKTLKEMFSKWYNRRFKRYGYFWGGRFKSIVIQDGIYYRICKNYIEMNPVRAGKVKKPEHYRFSSRFKEKMTPEVENEYKLFLKKLNFNFFENGLIIGSKNFIKKFHQRYGKIFNLKNSDVYTSILSEDGIEIFSLTKFPKRE